ncbi:MAG: hypothetical protein ACRD1K_06690 [Acidimicrobiales bacterium]
MRQVVAAGLAVSLLVGLPQEGQAVEAGCTESIVDRKPDGSTVVKCAKRHDPAPAPNKGVPGPPTPPMVRIATLADDGTGALCWRPGSRRVTAEEFAIESWIHNWTLVAHSYPRCPVAGKPDPEEVAIEVLERFPLPAPRPYIAPGRAITGLRAFLEPNLDTPVVAGLATYSGTRETALGEQNLQAVATYMVDWGDERTGPHRGPGGPWPDGNLSYVWTDMGTYDVVVTVNWQVAWRMGPDTGRLTVSTVGTIADFPVTQVQAVIHY